MNNQVAIAASAAGIASFLGQFIISLSSGGYTMGSQVEQIRSELSLIRKDVINQNQLVEYRLSKLEEGQDSR